MPIFKKYKYIAQLPNLYIIKMKITLPTTQQWRKRFVKELLQTSASMHRAWLCEEQASPT